ncbi:hypothetical protein ACIHFD_41780 [Nonomuraea sp. NPDC051941]|uniref:hypothetical protein n=1 Tax=Nonomuraea sp. NPDC051941 TaxID=3364373 RepID=UPI0037CC8855
MAMRLPAGQQKLPQAVNNPTPRVRFGTVGPPAIAVPTGCSAAEPMPPTMSRAKIAASAGATPIKLRNNEAGSTSVAPTRRVLRSSASAPKTGCVTDDAIE